MALLSKKSREGYFLLDHRFSPGITVEQARASGYDPVAAGEGKMFEAASLTCSHCKCSVIKNPQRTRERPHCFKCDHYICDLCAAKAQEPGYVHTPFVKIVDDHMDAAALGSPPSLLF